MIFSYVLSQCEPQSTCVSEQENPILGKILLLVHTHSLGWNFWALRFIIRPRNLCPSLSLDFIWFGLNSYRLALVWLVKTAARGGPPAFPRYQVHPPPPASPFPCPFLPPCLPSILHPFLLSFLCSFLFQFIYYADLRRKRKPCWCLFYDLWYHSI